MNKLIGITGSMGAGKTTLSKDILSSNKEYIYINVDDYRRYLLNNNQEYFNELKSLIPGLNNPSELNNYIYSNDEYMNRYKTVLYKYLFNYINSFNNKTIIVDWALILVDHLESEFDKLIYVDTNIDKRLERLGNTDLPREEVLKRMQLLDINIKDYNSNNLLVVDNNIKYDLNSVLSFINGIDCKFTLPNNEGKAIWEITHHCNYNCSYCIFSCNKKRNDNELTTEECFHVIDELVKHDFKHLKVTGGEPFIRKDIIDILRYASDKLITDISTNASLLTVEKVKELNKLKLKMIHVSLDGMKEQHESVRGLGTYSKTTKGLANLAESTNRIRIGTVIHANNENELESIVRTSAFFDADEIIFSIMEPVEGQDRSLVKTKTNEELLYRLNELKEKYKSRIIVNYNFGNSNNGVCRCPAGDKFIFIDNVGRISPCTWVYENDKTCISDISLRDHTVEECLKSKSLRKFMSSKEEGKCYGKI